MVVEYEFLNVAGIKLDIFQMLKAKSSQNETILKYKGKDKCYALNIYSFYLPTRPKILTVGMQTPSIQKLIE